MADRSVPAPAPGQSLTTAAWQDHLDHCDRCRAIDAASAAAVAESGESMRRRDRRTLDLRGNTQGGM